MKINRRIQPRSAAASCWFSGLAMTINMPANFLLLLWMLIIAVIIWRQGGNLSGEAAV